MSAARRLLAAPLAAVAGGSLATVLLASGASAASAPGPEAGLTPGTAAVSTSFANLYYTGTDGAVWQKTEPPNGQGASSLGGFLYSGPAPVWTPPGVLADSGAYAVFGRGGDGALWWTAPSVNRP